MLIQGKWIVSINKIAVINPYDNAVIDYVAQADNEQIELAIRSAQFGAIEMRQLSAYRRSEILFRTAELFKAEHETLSKSLVREVGKTIKEARTEVNRARQTFILAAEEAKRITGETVPIEATAGSENRFAFYTRFPVGIILAITPFNFPLNLAAHKIAPALAAGNSIILKPATKTPLTDLLLGKILLAAGLPENGFNIVTGQGSQIGVQLVSDSRIRKISFTGSADIGKQIMHRAGLKKVTMELGSNSAVIIMDDADLDQASDRIKLGGFTLAGQVCISVQRVFVQERVLSKFLETLVPKVENLKLGDPMDENTDVGPMISDAAINRVSSWLEEAVDAGGKILCGGNYAERLFQPTIIFNPPHSTKVCQEELFAPAVVVIPFNTLDDAIQLVNDSKYGLQAGIFTRDLNTAFRAFREIEVGGVIVNDIPTYRADLMPYGGMKESGIGREGVKYAIQEMTEIKLACFNLSS
ncbi:MAG: aldehyde dehydrogenase family protein [bacterium]|nr:aldehyde dehydrogenase family protein [bacterium]